MSSVSCAGAVKTVHHPDSPESLALRSDDRNSPIDGISQNSAITISTMLTTPVAEQPDDALGDGAPPPDDGEPPTAVMTAAPAGSDAR